MFGASKRVRDVSGARAARTVDAISGAWRVGWGVHGAFDCLSGSGRTFNRWGLSTHVSELGELGFGVRRLSMPSTGVESWTIGPDRRPLPAVEEFLAWLTNIERSPNTVEAYARDLKAFWSFLASRELEWDGVTLSELGEFAAWARQPADNVVVLSELAVPDCTTRAHR